MMEARPDRTESWSTRSTLIGQGAGLLIAACASGAVLVSSPAWAQFISSLPPQAGTADTYGQSIDAAGLVAGYSADRAVLWRPSATGYLAEALPTLPGYPLGGANAIGGSGIVAGYGQPNDLSTANAMVWTPAAGTYVPTALPAPVGAVLTDAYAINATGTTAGYALDSGDATAAVIWEPAGGSSRAAALLPKLSGWNDTAATAINDAGDVAGYAFVQSGFSQTLQGVVWQNAAGGRTAKAVISAQPALITAINNTGTGAGVYDLDQPLVMVKYEDEYYALDLPTPFGATSGATNAVNNHDALVGYLTDPDTIQSGHEAGLWLPTETQWDYVNLDQWLDQVSPSLGARWVLREATSISDTWLVTGYGEFDSLERGFVLDVSSLVPEPAGSILALAGLSLLVRRSRRS